MNVIGLSGRLVADPELRTTGTGKAVANFRIAVDRDYKDSQGNRQADFFNCVLWGDSGKRMCEWKHKGDVVEVVGRLENRSYTAQDGSKRQATEVIVGSWKGWSAATKEGVENSGANGNSGTFTEVDDDELPF